MNLESMGIPKNTFSHLKEKIERAGFSKLFRLFPQGEFFLVGGGVRDLVLGRDVLDLDIVVRGVSLKDLEQALTSLGKVQYVGKAFGVFKLIPDPPCDFGTLDIALPRTEKSIGRRGGYREFEITSDANLPLEEDLKRRDFTINAMAINLGNEEILDPFGGMAALKSKTLQAVGDPQQRFQEDYSRILRGIRFACQLGFQLEKETWSSICGLMKGLQARREDETFIVPREVLGKELVRSFVYDPVRAWDLLDASGAMAVILPEILPMKGCPQPSNFHSEGDVWTHTRLALSQLSSKIFHNEFQERSFDAEIVFATLFHDIGKPGTLKTPEKDGTDRIRFDGHDRVGGKMAQKICTRLKLSQFPKEDSLHLDTDRLVWLIEKHLLLVQGQVQEMKATTIERYFLNPTVPGRSLLKLILVDSLATIHDSGHPDLTSYFQLKDRIHEIQNQSNLKRDIPPPLLRGEDVMNLFDIGPCPKVGEILGCLREEQLNGRVKDQKEALVFLQQIKGKIMETKEEEGLEHS